MRTHTPDTPESRRARRAISALGLILLGCCLIHSGVEWISALGCGAVAFGLLHGGTLLWSSSAEWLKKSRIRRERERQERMRARRRVRQQELEEARAHQRLLEAHAEEEREAAERSRDAAERERAERDRALRAESERRIDEEAHRLQTASEEELLAAVAQALVRRGLAPMAEPETEACDRRFAAADGSIHLVRCVYGGRKARSLDVRAAEDWRKRAGAAHAYLIASAGFRADAVGAVSGVAVTLVDPYLLAHWIVIGAPAPSA